MASVPSDWKMPARCRPCRRTIFKWGEREGLVERSPFNYPQSGTVKLFDEPQRERDTYTDDEYRLLFREAERVGDLLIRDMIIVLADTGLRLGELANLTPESLHWETAPPHIDIRARNGWKPKDPREVKQIPMSRQDVPASVTRWPLTFPPEPVEGAMLSGLGVPDVRGFLSGSVLYHPFSHNARMTIPQTMHRYGRCTPCQKK